MPSTQSPTTANVPFFPCVCANVRACDHFHSSMTRLYWSKMRFLYLKLTYPKL